jgi:hypothetical protein
VKEADHRHRRLLRARRQRPRGRAAEQRDEPSTLGALDRGDGIGFKTRPQTRTLLD